LPSIGLPGIFHSTSKKELTHIPVLSGISCIFASLIKKQIIMALEIKRAPVLRGKAARDFLKAVEEMAVKESQKTKEELEERAKGIRETREYLARQKSMQLKG
jgi:hypothetical protein